jgi:hypothetical protein
MSDVTAASPGPVDAHVSLCPKCGGAGLRRSHVRFYEKPRKWLTASRPYRCAYCRARVWGSFEGNGTGYGHVEFAEPIPSPPLDLTAIDRSIERI